MPIIARTLLFVGVMAVASLILRSILARFIKPVHVREAEGTADVVMEAMAGLYGVLVAFLLAGAWERYDDMRGTLMLELSQLTDLHQIAQLLPAPTSEQLDTQVYAFIEQERSALQTNYEPGNSELTSTLQRMVTILAQFEPATSTQSLLQDKALDAVDELATQHRILLHSRHRQLPALVWVVLIGGGSAMLILVAISSRTSRLAATYLVLITIVISLALYTIYALSYPARTGFLNEVSPRLQHLLEPRRP